MRAEKTIQIYSNAAKDLNRVFLEEMVNHILPKPEGTDFGGGVGEAQFASFLNREYAAALSKSLDLGLKVGRDG
ncbi:MAG: rod-binding protein [Hyphomicrobiaceae bacterium]